MDGLEAFERNWIGLFEALPRYVPDARFWSEGNISVGVTGLPVAAFNAVFVHDQHSLTPSQLSRLTESFNGLPFSIQVCSRQLNPRCAAFLQAQDYEVIFADPILIREGPLLETPINPAIVIRPVASTEDKAHFERIVAKGFGMSPDSAPDFFETLANLQEGREMLAWLDDQPVGTGMLLYCNGTAAVYNVATLPEVQRQGIGTAMMYALQERALADGYTATVLASSTAGLRLYRKLGYRHDGYQIAYAPVGLQSRIGEL